MHCARQCQSCTKRKEKICQFSHDFQTRPESLSMDASFLMEALRMVGSCTDS